MLHHLHTTIVALLYDERRGNIPPAEVDVLFDIPSHQWVEALARPAVCCYLFDMAEVAEFRNATSQVTRANGRAVTKLPPRRVDLRYLVCAFSSSRADEQALVWRAMAVFMKHTTLPADLMPDELRKLDVTVTTKIGPYPDAPKLLELWGALDLPPRPALLLSVTAPLDLELEFDAPLVLTRVTRFTRPSDEDLRRGRGVDPEHVSQRGAAEQFYEPYNGVAIDPRAPEPRFAIAGVVRDRQNNPLKSVVVGVEGRAAESTIDADGREQTCSTGADGRFALANLRRGDRLWVRRGDKKTLLNIYVPSPIYDIVLD
ncbi:Pvc16 family protein [Kouleothrix sp.]|uniref:Pvc16 family protein n=1 Tax=Kouleothrix sp. TaxID=2779161 RepID=UPI00391DA15F